MRGLLALVFVGGTAGAEPLLPHRPALPEYGPHYCQDRAARPDAQADALALCEQSAQSSRAKLEAAWPTLPLGTVAYCLEMMDDIARLAPRVAGSYTTLWACVETDSRSCRRAETVNILSGGCV